MQRPLPASGFYLALLLPLLLAAAVRAAPGNSDGDGAKSPEKTNWVDNTHAYATRKTQQLTRWMDHFFGDPEYDLEQAESFLRVQFIDDWNQPDGNNLDVRLRGKVELPRISRRLRLVFSGEDREELDEQERQDEDPFGIQYQLTEGSETRIDLTLGFSSDGPRPGIRLRHDGELTAGNTYRFTERLQYDREEEFFSSTRLDFDHALRGDSVVRWSNRVLYGQNTDGTEWRSRIALRQRLMKNSERSLAVSYYAGANGVTDPDHYVRNYRLGAVARRQVYRDFLFLEVEPAYNFERPALDQNRSGFWSVELRLEVALEKNLQRIGNAGGEEDSVADKGGGD